MSYQDITNDEDYLKNIDTVDLLGYIASSSIDTNDIKEKLKSIFSENSIRVQSNILDKIVNLIEESIDDSNHNTIKKFLSYLKENYNLSFVREHTDEVLIFDEDVTNID